MSPIVHKGFKRIIGVDGMPSVRKVYLNGPPPPKKGLNISVEPSGINGNSVLNNHRLPPQYVNGDDITLSITHLNQIPFLETGVGVSLSEPVSPTPVHFRL